MKSMNNNPSVIVDFGRARQNIAKVLADARFKDIDFRPHFKTHQSAQTAECFRSLGIQQITVASLPMAQYFASHQWNDILIAMPLNPSLNAQYNELAATVHLRLLVDHLDALNSVLSLENPVAICLKADAGYGRAGVKAENIEWFLKAATLIQQSQKHRFGGIVSHFGNTYHATSSQEIVDINTSSLAKLKVLKSFLEQKTGAPCRLSIGDTPSLPHYTSDMLVGIDELRPGNFVYYDMMQVALGTCQISDVAVAFAAPILSLYPERNEALIQAGAVHLSKEKCLMPDGKIGYGAVVRLLPNGCIGEVVQNCFVDRISQEHGILRCAPSFFNEYKIGDVIGVLPVHSCLMVSAMAGK